MGYFGRITYDPFRPDGTPDKLPDVTRIASLEWHAEIGLREGIADTHAWFREQHADAPLPH